MNRSSILGLCCFFTGGIVIPAAKAEPSVVYVTASDSLTLQRVRAIAPNAFRTSIGDRPVIQAGRFSNQANADSLLTQLHAAGLSARQIMMARNVPNALNPFHSLPTAPITIEFNREPSPTPVVPAIAYSPSVPVASVHYPYVTAVPARLSDSLQQVQQYAPKAFLTSSSRGQFVYAGSYANRAEAEAMSNYLRSRGIDARVLYF